RDVWDPHDIAGRPRRTADAGRGADRAHPLARAGRVLRTRRAQRLLLRALPQISQAHGRGTVCAVLAGMSVEISSLLVWRFRGPHDYFRNQSHSPIPKFANEGHSFTAPVIADT